MFERICYIRVFILIGNILINNLWSFVDWFNVLIIISELTPKYHKSSKCSLTFYFAYIFFNYNTAKKFGVSINKFYVNISKKFED